MVGGKSDSPVRMMPYGVSDTMSARSEARVTVGALGNEAVPNRQGGAVCDRQSGDSNGYEPGTASGLAERRLVERVADRCGKFIAQACKASSVPPEFLGALAANESGGNPGAMRFEPAVYRHLKALAAGESPRYNGLSAEDLAGELDEVLHPKAVEFHARYLTAPFASRHARALSTLEDEALRELATSWGFTQIMGFHMAGRRGTARDLLDPQIHFRVALDLLVEFAEDYQLDLTREFAELFRCWNTGQPYGHTTDPAYVQNGLWRMELYRQQAKAAPQAAAAAA
jgi:hypothetical protein